MHGLPSPHAIQALRSTHVGRRVRLEFMVDDPRPLPPGSKGTVTSVDDAGTVHIKWDNGRQLGLIPGADLFELI